ncbi:hypothetical protein [Mesorhizobium sp. WSM2240]|uniref:Uncharacterized protein n=1 Tax=Mesorhizobium sp. WSM2239 TaxID=3228852 RepID=A0AAU8DFN5_9HYPH
MHSAALLVDRVPAHLPGAEGAFIELCGLGGAVHGEVSHDAAKDARISCTSEVAAAADVVAMSLLLFS